MVVHNTPYAIVVVFSSLFYTSMISTEQMIYRCYDRIIGRPLALIKLFGQVYTP